MINLECEVAVLGAVISDNEALENTINKIKIDDSIDNRHKIIYKNILQVNSEKLKLDTISLIKTLNKNNDLDSIGGSDYIYKICLNHITSANIKQNINFILENKIENETKKLQKEISVKTEKGQIIDLNEIREKIDAIETIKENKTISFINAKEAVNEALNKIEQNYKNFQSGNKINGLETGFIELDDMVNGFNGGNLIVVGARPSMGKSVFLSNIAEKISRKKNVAFFSLEMSNDELMFRILAKNSNLDLKKIKNGHLQDEDWLQIVDAFTYTSNLKLFINSDPNNITINKIREQCLRMKSEEKIDFIVIDYLQLMEGTRRTENRQQEISEITRNIKLLAKELNIPIMVAVQLSRGCEQRQDKRPMLSDIRESGAIEQDADVVMFLYRDAYYNPETEKQNIAEIIVGKNRNGEIGKIYLGFDGGKSRFVNLEKGIKLI